MNTIFHALAAVMLLSLYGCDKPLAAHDTEQKNNPGQYGDEGIEREKDKSIDEKIQIEPPKPDGSPEIIVPPPKVNMPPEILPEKPAK